MTMGNAPGICHSKRCEEGQHGGLQKWWIGVLHDQYY